ncbi:MAG TPA: carboxypeptidase regulatory-like domain-containing protein [Bryobacteraceae bacterium]|nr:carboxypeptidase regulatory-like domain-containing protein [Bryobacteraceae bacterium]
MFEILRSKAIFSSRNCAVAAMLLAAVLFSLSAFGQNAAGTISGTVIDASGAVVPHADVVLTDEGTNAKRDTVSNNSGFFNFAAVQPGSYSVTVTAKGFRPWEQRTIIMTQGNNLNLPNISLQVGSEKQEVLVVGNEVAVPTDTGAVSHTLNEHMITELAIQGRDAAELMKIMPGMGNAQGLSQSMFSSLVTQSNTGPIGTMTAQGAQLYGGLTMMSDGASLLDPGNMGTQTANINQNQIQEVSLLTSAYGAEYAKGPIVFQALGKTGSAQFHGGGYLYARNGVFNTTDSYFKANGVAKPDDHYYYPGGDFGGPVILPWTHFNRNHDKLFFYAAYEYMDQHPAGSINQRFIPTQQMMQGNFSPTYLASLGPNFANGTFGNNAVAPCATPTSCTQGAYFPGGIIPPTMIDKNSLALYSTMPQPNTNPQSNPIGANYTQLLNLPINRWELRLRGDYNISQKTKAFFSWNRQDETDLNPNNIWWGTGNDLPYPTQMPANQVSNVYSANVTHIFSPTLTNEVVFADATFLNPIALANPAAVNPSKIGFSMTGLFTNPYTPQIPNTISWSKAAPGYFAPTFGQAFEGGDFGKLSQAPNLADNLTKVAGTHTLKFGFYWDYSRNFQAGSNFQNSNQGTVEFETYGANTTSNGAADFVTARIAGFFQADKSPVQDVRYYQYAWYANDQWKVSRRLTLTLGLRFDHLGNWVPTNNNIGLAVWDPASYNNTSSAPGFTGLLWHGINNKIPLSGVPSYPINLEPRFGAAYDVFGDGKTVIRGGFGIYRYQASANNVSSANYSAPLGVQSQSTTWNCCIGYNSFNQFSPSLGAPGLGSAINGVDQQGDARTPYSMTYNVTISQRAPWRSVWEVQYSGSASRQQILDGTLSDQNLIPIGAFFKPDPITGQIVSPYSSSFNSNDYYPYHNYTGIQLFSHGGYTNYNAFITTWVKQTGRMTFTTNYTFSKVMGTRDGQTFNGNQAGSAEYPYSVAANYGPLAYDHSHIFNAAYVINLPSPIHGNKILAGTVNGWEFSGITQWQSGPPLQANTGANSNAALNASYGNNANGPTSAQTYLGTTSMALLPVLTCDPRMGLKSGQYFNPSCFTPPQPGQVGQIVWPYIKGPALFNSDLSLYKNFQVKEKQKIQFRFEAFNFLNHPLPEFNATGNNADVQLKFSDSAGNLTTTNQNHNTTGAPLFTVNRRVIEFAIRYMF